MDKYDDIINLENPKSKKHPHMSLYERAAQFSPFAALSGYEESIEEIGRITASRIDLGEYEEDILNKTLKEIEDNISVKPLVAVLYFEKDLKKSGGEYIHYIGNVRSIDMTEKILKFTSKKNILLNDIYKIDILWKK